MSTMQVGCIIDREPTGIASVIDIGINIGINIGIVIVIVIDGRAGKRERNFKSATASSARLASPAEKFSSAK